MATIQGTAGDDSLAGTSGGDDFHMEQGGHDTVSGGAGIDVFYFGASFDPLDQIDGGADKDYLVLDGDYSAGVKLTATTLVNVEVIQLTAGHDYKITGLSDANLVNGVITIDGSGLAGSDGLTFDASGLVSGAVSIRGGGGHDVLTGGDGNDTLDGGGGHDSIRGGAGNDQISGGFGSTLGGGLGNDSFTVTGGAATVMGGADQDRIYMTTFDSASVIDGGDSAFDEVVITGDHQHFTIDAAMMTGVEYLDLARYDKVKLAAGLVGGDQTLQIVAGNAQHYDGGLTVDGHKEKGDLTMIGGGLRDVFLGGAGDDTLQGNGGNDQLTGGKGADVLSGGYGSTFIYKSITDSTVAHPDQILDLGDNQIIDLHRIDADTTTAGDQAFHLVSAFGGHAGELVVSYDSFRNVTSMSGDVNGDGQADFQITTDGNNSGFTHFVL
jgi:Ca2+-binding RTX toxin-like protein